MVAKCIREGKTLEKLSLEEYKEASPLIEADIYEAIDLRNCVQKRVSAGGTSVQSVEKQIAAVRNALKT
jgi:argininosuccinate lyase